MSLLYFLFWLVIALRELGDLYRGEHWKGMAAWLGLALLGLALWLVYRQSAWRLAEWLLGQ